MLTYISFPLSVASHEFTIKVSPHWGWGEGVVAVVGGMGGSLHPEMKKLPTERPDVMAGNPFKLVQQ